MLSTLLSTGKVCFRKTKKGILDRLGHTLIWSWKKGWNCMDTKGPVLVWWIVRMKTRKCKKKGNKACLGTVDGLEWLNQKLSGDKDAEQWALRSEVLRPYSKECLKPNFCIYKVLGKMLVTTWSRELHEMLLCLWTVILDIMESPIIFEQENNIFKMMFLEN